MLLEENVQKKLLDISLDSNFLGMIRKAQTTKTKINEWNYIKFKSFCTTEEIINKIKRQPTEWKKIIANYILGKGLLSKIYKEHLTT